MYRMLLHQHLENKLTFYLTIYFLMLLVLVCAVSDSYIITCTVIWWFIDWWVALLDIGKVFDNGIGTEPSVSNWKTSKDNTITYVFL